MMAPVSSGLPPALLWPFAVAVVAVLGSFLNVCIARLPHGESVVTPPSHCPSCQSPIRFYDNVPLVSFVLLGGRCRACRTPISWRYPLVEGLAVGVSVLVLWRLGPTWEALRVLALGLILIVVTFIDLDTKKILDVVTMPGIAAGLLLRLYPSPWGTIDGLHGLLLGCGLFYLISWTSFVALGQEGMGWGDINLAGLLGAFLGWQRLLVACFLGFLAGGLVGGALLLLGRRGRRDEVPYGPFLALGGFLAALWGDSILMWYLG